MLDEAFRAVNQRFLQAYRAAGNSVAETHHWNYPRSNFPEQVLAPRNLVPVPDRLTHDLIHIATSIDPVNASDGPISRIHELPIGPPGTTLVPTASH